MNSFELHKCVQRTREFSPREMRSLHNAIRHATREVDARACIIRAVNMAIETPDRVQEALLAIASCDPRNVKQLHSKHKSLLFL